MKKMSLAIILSLLFWTPESVYSQKYSKVADTIKLNKEYLDRSSDIADLNVKLLESQEALKKYQSAVADKNKDAQSSAESSSDQASKATNGSVKDAKKAKRKANAAYNDAKQAEDANDKAEKEEKRIKKITTELAKKGSDYKSSM